MSAQAEMRLFTDTQGRTMRAEFVSQSGDQVTLKREDGQTVTVGLNLLSAMDIHYLQELQRQQASSVSAASPAAANTLPPGSIVIEALVDGESTLMVKRDGFYWVNGRQFKPGMHMGKNEPTYVDGEAWMPDWEDAATMKGNDRSAVRRMMALDPAALDFQLLSVSAERGGQGIEKRDAIKVEKIKRELAIKIPDTQGGSRWYRFALTPKK